MNEFQEAPIVLVHGILGFNQLKLAGMTVAEYFRFIPDALRKDGHVVPNPPQLNPAGSIAERAQDLKTYLQDKTNLDVAGKRVHIIAHSMGGLDSRFMIAKLGMEDRVLSLTTIGTPHHGSPIADIVMAGINPKLSKLLEHAGIDIKGGFDLTTGACQEFNKTVLDSPNVSYFSIAGHFEPSLIPTAIGFSHKIIKDKDGPNDGLVSVASATFTERPESWVTLNGWDANHFRMINWGSNIAPSPAESKDPAIVKNYLALAALIKELSATKAS